ncbi:MAG: hypothetical protein COA69_10905 [Robiginitomaculum sp.]|nr:MAG: hypothetical protein COA69_10905 [Robiginitomaculum sp.]
MTLKTSPLPPKQTLLVKIRKSLDTIDEAVNYDPMAHLFERVHLLETRLQKLEQEAQPASEHC